MIHCWDNKPLRDLEYIIDLFEFYLTEHYRCVFCHEQKFDGGRLQHKESCQITKARNIISSLECGDD